MLYGLGVSGGIAAYKSCELVSRLKKLGADVHVIMTRNAEEFVAPLSFETLSDNKVVRGMFEEREEHDVRHVALAKLASVTSLLRNSPTFSWSLPRLRTS